MGASVEVEVQLGRGGLAMGAAAENSWAEEV